MSVIIQLQNLPLSASSVDIRKFFGGLNIPPGGVHIVGGEKGSAFIAFANDEDARRAMERNGRRVKEARVRLALSSHRELKKVLELLHKEQIDYHMSRKMRLPESKQERNKPRPKKKRSRSRSLERNRYLTQIPLQEFSSDHHTGGKYDDGLQRENPYDRHNDRKVQYGESFLGTSGTDKPNPYVSSTYPSDADPEEERNEEIRRRIETFIAAFGQAENYNLDLKKDAYPNKPFKADHDGFSPPGGKEAVQNNRSQGFPTMPAPAENYPSKSFDDFDTRRHFDDLRPESSVSASDVHASKNTSYNPLREQNERVLYNAGDQNFSSHTNYNVLEDRLLNSPMDIEDDKTDNGSEKFQPNQHFGPPMFGAPDEVSKAHGGSASVSIASTSFNNAFPFQTSQNPGGNLRPNVFEKGHPKVIPIDAAKDFCIKLEGLPFYATENDIRRRVFRDQSIFDMFIPYNSEGKATGTGFVQFSSAEDLLAVVKMKYCMIGESRVEFHGSSRAALMEARMLSVGGVSNNELSSTYHDVLALKRTQDMLSSMLSSREPTVSTSHPVMSPMGPTSYPTITSLNQQAEPPAKRSLCAVITGLPSHFSRHIQVLKCIENTGINFHLIHLVLNNRSRFTGKVFAEFHDLRDLDAALKKHNQDVEGFTIGVKQVLHEEMLKFLNSHKSRCMYPTPKLPDYLEKKPEKAPYIWEPPYGAAEKLDKPAVWSSERPMKDQRLGPPGDFFPHRDFGVNSSYGANSYARGSSHQRQEMNRFEDTERINPPNSGDLYGDFNKTYQPFQGERPPFHGNLEMNFSERESRSFVSPQSKEERGFSSRKNDNSASRDKHRGRSRSPIDNAPRNDFPRDQNRFRNVERDGNEDAEFFDLESRTGHRVIHKKRDGLVEETNEFISTAQIAELEADLRTCVQRNSTKMKEASGTPFKKKSHDSPFPQKNSKPDEQNLKPKHGESPSDSTSPKTTKRRFEHRRNCPKRQKNHHIETDLLERRDRSRDNDHSKPDDRTRPVDRSRRNRSRSSDRLRLAVYVKSNERSRPADRAKFDDRSRPSDHTRFDDRSKPSDRSRPSDHSRFDDHSKPSDRSRFDDHSKPSDRSRFDDRSKPSDRSRFSDRSRSGDRSRHRYERKESHGALSPEELFKQPGCVLEATNVDPHVGLYELLDFFRGYGLHSENLIRRYTDTGEPTGDLRIAFLHPEDAEQAHKILNRQYLKGRTVLLSFV